MFFNAPVAGIVPQRLLLEKSLHQRKGKNNVTAWKEISARRNDGKTMCAHATLRLGSPASSLGIGPVRRLLLTRLSKHIRSFILRDAMHA